MVPVILAEEMDFVREKLERVSWWGKARLSYHSDAKSEKGTVVQHDSR